MGPERVDLLDRPSHAPRCSSHLGHVILCCESLGERDTVVGLVHEALGGLVSDDVGHGQVEIIVGAVGLVPGARVDLQPPAGRGAGLGVVDSRDGTVQPEPGSDDWVGH
jgi:hypothetical protein